MQVYHELLRITEKIEGACKEDKFQLLTSLQKERCRVFDRLPTEVVPGQLEIVETIKLIRSSEDRCMQLMTARKNHLREKMGKLGRAKKLHNAYGRQALAY